jgi:hypothetical protein
MKWLAILLVAAGGYFAWKQYSAQKAAEPPVAADKTKTTGANVENRINTLSGSAPDPDAR